MPSEDLLQNSKEMENGRNINISEKEEKVHQIKIFDFKKLEKRKWVDESHQIPPKNFAKQVGLTSWAEDFFYIYYENKGYEVKNLQYGRDLVFNNVDFAWKLKNKGIENINFAEYDSEKMKYNPEPGTPDLLVKNEDEYFFVEVKTSNDGLRTNQLNWIFEKDVTVKVAVVDIISKEEVENNA